MEHVGSPPPPLPPPAPPPSGVPLFFESHFLHFGLRRRYFRIPDYYALGSADDIFESQKTTKNFKNDTKKHPKGFQNLHNHVKIGAFLLTLLVRVLLKVALLIQGRWHPLRGQRRRRGHPGLWWYDVYGLHKGRFVQHRCRPSNMC